jgi:hypothetical protein
MTDPVVPLVSSDHEQCPWCLIRGRVVIECLLCWGSGWAAKGLAAVSFTPGQKGS